MIFVHNINSINNICTSKPIKTPQRINIELYYPQINAKYATKFGVSSILLVLFLYPCQNTLGGKNSIYKTTDDQF